jgi:hypothetical protein
MDVKLEACLGRKSLAEFTASNDPDAQKRRSTRIVQAVPITVVGVDALGQPFKERTSSLIISCHGCKYQSKHYVPKNAQVTLEIPRPEAELPNRSVRGRIIWVQRPRTVRELFQIGVEFQSPGNVWGIAFPPADWLRVPDDLAPGIPAPVAEHSERGAAPQSFPAAESLASNKIRLVPEDSSTTPAQLSMTFARQMARMLADAKQGLQQTIQESASAAVEEASRGVHLQIEAQIRQTIDKAVQSALAQVEAHASERAAELTAHARPVDVNEPSPEWLRAAEHNLRTIANQVTAQLSEVTEAQRAALSVHAERIVEQARHQANGLFGRIEADAGAAQEQLAQSRREIEAAALSIRSEGTQSLAAFREELAQQLSRAKGLVEELNAARTRAEATASQISNSAESIIAESERRLDKLLHDRNSHLQQRAQELITERVREMQPALETMAQNVIGRLAEQAHQRLAPQIELAQKVSSELTAGRQTTEQLIAAIHQRLTEAADQTLLESRERLQQQMAHFPIEIEAACRASVSKAAEEIDAKSNEVTHTTFESLYKSSEWYQKKAQTSMQAALEKSVDQAVGGLRNHAADISRLFASELDHYSRSYVEHTQGQLEESVKDSTARGRTQMQQAADTTAAAFSDRLHQASREALQNFTASVRQSSEETATQFEARAEGLRANMDAHLENFVADFQDRLNERVELGVDQARRVLDNQLTSMTEAWRQERDQQYRAWLERLNQASAEGVEAYRQRLENTSNSWLVASVTSLSQHSEEVIKAMALAAEVRLRDTCSNVFAGLGETIRQRLLGISSELAPGQNPPEKIK